VAIMKNRISSLNIVVALVFGFTTGALAIASHAHAQWSRTPTPVSSRCRLRTTAGDRLRRRIRQRQIWRSAGGRTGRTKHHALYRRVRPRDRLSIMDRQRFRQSAGAGFGQSSALNFGRFQGGVDFPLMPGTHL